MTAGQLFVPLLDCEVFFILRWLLMNSFAFCQFSFLEQGGTTMTGVVDSIDIIISIGSSQ